MNSFLVESLGADCSSAVYVKDGDEWVLVLVVDPDPKDWHPWPDRVTDKEAKRWRRSCTVKRVEWRRMVGVAL